jgi:transposase
MEVDSMSDGKLSALKSNGSYNRHADSVSSPLFTGNPYFDAHDLVQVKYEMLRAVNHDGLSISEAAKQFGFSRTAYYKIEKGFKMAGVDGLYLKKTGPKVPAKATADIMQFADDLKKHHPDFTNNRLVEEIKNQKGVSIHKRSLQRERAKKKRV